MRQLTAIPNILSFFRILLIPEFVWLSLSGERQAALFVLILSGLSDLLDGAAARGLGTITPLGRVLDPVADKLTQLAVLICLSARYPGVFWLLVILIVKETGAFLCGSILLAAGGKPFSSMWFGKLSTFSLYVFFGLLLAFELPESITLPLGTAVALIMIFASVLYTNEFVRRIWVRRLPAKRMSDTEDDR